MVTVLQDVIATQKRDIEESLRAPYVERRVRASALSPDMVTAILGPRRAGKSFFALHYLASSGPFGYANFDDERLVQVDDYDQILAAIDVVYNRPRALLFDEIQNLPRWELFVNRLQRQGCRLVLSGSNAHLLSGELATHLTGRHLPVVLLPFSFAEYVSAVATRGVQAESRELLVRYLSDGGFPEPLLRDVDRRTYLSTLLESTIYKDVVRRFKLRSARAIDDLMVYLLSNIATEMSPSALAGVAGCRSHHTVEKYLGYLERTLLLFRLPRFDYSVKKQMSHNKKIYCIDNGYITSRGFSSSPNYGKLAENLVAVCLKKREMEGRASIYFWKNPEQEEVDFVVKEGPRVVSLIQVCWNVDSPRTHDREIRALLKGARDLRCDDLIVLNESRDETEHAEWYGLKGDVKFVPLWEWLLAEA